MVIKMSFSRFRLEDVGQIGEVDVEFGDLTVLVGPQATGKSLFLQLFAHAIDSASINRMMDKYGLVWDEDLRMFLNLYLGDGMGQVWNLSESKMYLDDKKFVPDLKVPEEDVSDRTYYVPAQRAMVFRDGWPQPFGSYSIKDPFAVRFFSERTRSFLDNPKHDMEQVFPIQGKLKEGTRDLLDRAVFHGSAISQDRSSGRRELRLSAGEGKISFMSWSTGQREFVPLLLGMYELLPGGKISRRSGVEWVILEEIEAGLHPEAVFSVMSMVLELLDRGYKVVISTHSPYVLDLLWAIRSIKGLALSSEDKERAVCGLFDISDPAMSLKKSMSNVLDKDVRIHLLRYGQGGMVQSKEISSLDPASEDEDVSGWGGLSGYSGQVSDLVADFVSKSRRF